MKFSREIILIGLHVLTQSVEYLEYQLELFGNKLFQVLLDLLTATAQSASVQVK